MFAKNAKGRSDSIWLRAQTLRAPDHLVENQDFLGTTDLIDYSRFYTLFRSPLSLAFAALTLVTTLTVISLAIVVSLKSRRRSSLASSSCQFRAGTVDLTSSLEPEEDAKRASGSFMSPDAPMPPDQEKKCTCDDEYCDEGLPPQQQQFTNPYQGRDYGWEGPPDIILYFPYSTAAPASADPTSSYALNEGLALEKNFASPFGMLCGSFPPPNRLLFRSVP